MSFEVGQGEAGRGLARHGGARHGGAWKGGARLVRAGRGMAWQGQ